MFSLPMADRVVLLVDSTKFKAAAPVKLCELSEVDLVISDTEQAAGGGRRFPTPARPI